MTGTPTIDNWLRREIPGVNDTYLEGADIDRKAAHAAVKMAMVKNGMNYLQAARWVAQHYPQLMKGER